MSHGSQLHDAASAHLLQTPQRAPQQRQLVRRWRGRVAPRSGRAVRDGARALRARLRPPLQPQAAQGAAHPGASALSLGLLHCRRPARLRDALSARR